MTEQLFKGQVAIVTGAGGGMGREHALLLARLGASVVVNDVSKAARRVVEEIESAGGRATTSHHDISDPGQAGELVQSAVDAFGGLHIVVSNAGIIRNVPFAEMDLEKFDRVMKVNAYGAFNVVRAAWPHFQTQRYGRLVMVGSSSAWVSQPLIAHYAASKGAVLGLTKTLAAEGGPLGITANVIAPGAFTAMSGEMTDEHARKLAETRMAPRLVSPVVAWLARRENQFNGEIFEVAAGRAALNFVGSTPGYWSKDLTVADLVAHEDEVVSREGYAVLPDTVKLSEWMTGANTGWGAAE